MTYMGPRSIYRPPHAGIPAPADYPDAPVNRILDVSTEGAELFAVLVAIGGDIPLHYHPVMELQFVLSGTGLALDADGGETPIGPGGAVLSPAGAAGAHGFRNTGPCRSNCFASIPLPAVSPQAVRPSRRPADPRCGRSAVGEQPTRLDQVGRIETLGERGVDLAKPVEPLCPESRLCIVEAAQAYGGAQLRSRGAPALGRPHGGFVRRCGAGVASIAQEVAVHHVQVGHVGGDPEALCHGCEPVGDLAGPAAGLGTELQQEWPEDRWRPESAVPIEAFRDPAQALVADAHRHGRTADDDRPGGAPDAELMLVCQLDDPDGEPSSLVRLPSPQPQERCMEERVAARGGMVELRLPARWPGATARARCRCDPATRAGARAP